VSAFARISKFQVLFVYEVCMLSVPYLFSIEIVPFRCNSVAVLVEGNEVLDLFVSHRLGNELNLDFLAFFEHALRAS